jgi:hypothetical protein
VKIFHADKAAVSEKWSIDKGVGNINASSDLGITIAVRVTVAVQTVVVERAVDEWPDGGNKVATALGVHDAFTCK